MISAILFQLILRLLCYKALALAAPPHATENPSPIPDLSPFTELSGPMVLVPGGKFYLGDLEGTHPHSARVKDSIAIDSAGYKREGYVRTQVDSFFIGKHEVSQALWQGLMGNNPSRFKCDSCPVNTISWLDAQDFIQKLNQHTGMEFRLPREHEWEFAAKGGNLSQGYRYAGSDTLYKVGWYARNSGKHYLTGAWNRDSLRLNRCRPHPHLKQHHRKANELGLYDMSGNVMEWCQDWFTGYPYFRKVQSDCASGGCRKILRGGSWYHAAKLSRVTHRYSAFPAYKKAYYGFRLAHSVRWKGED